MKYQIVILDGNIVTGRSSYRASIGIHDGRIAAISQSGPLEGDDSIDANGLMVMPGVVDVHTHFRDPAHPQKEDFTSGSRAGAVGGVTTICEMPMADRGTCTAERLQQRRDIIGPKTLVDFSLYGGAGQQSVDDIRGTAAAGAVGFKSFLREPYAARATNFEGTWVTDDGALFKIAHEVAATGLVWSVHAENFDIVQALEAGLGEQIAVTSTNFRSVRPTFVETEPVAKLIAYARLAGARLHIAHITTAAGVELVRQARNSGMDVTCEVCIPHLIFVEDQIPELAPLGYFTPRLRTTADQQAMWDGLADGTITLIASDHSSYTREDVEQGWNADVVLSPAFATAGSASIEFMLPLVLTAVREGKLPLNVAVSALTERPAELFGLSPRKGRLEVGSDADLVVVDLDARQTIDASTMQSKAKISPFEGIEVTGIPLHTLVRGTPVVRDGKVVGTPGHGQYVHTASRPT